MNPEKLQNLTQHSCCSMLTLHEKLKSRRGNGYHFIQKGDTFPLGTTSLLEGSSGLQEAYTKVCPNSEKLPQHVGAML